VSEVLRVRYYECDMQQVVHNSVYLAWCDDVADRRFRPLGAGVEGSRWDVMVKTATVTWSSSARLGDEISIEVTPSRMGNTSFELTFTGSRSDDSGPVFTATITYVAVRAGSGEPVRVPDDFRAAVTRW
jgi:acyl-CoA thioester hydrolase